MAYLGKSPSQGVRNRYYFTASGGETSISGAITGGTLTFSDGNYVDVTLNGVTLVAGTDYNTSTANTIAGLTALTASDVVEIVVYDVFSVFSGNVNSDFSVGGNLSVTGTTAFTGATTITGLTTTGDINFGDNDKAIFGAGSDLQIYHNGTDSVVDDQGTGKLVLKGNTAVEVRGTNGEDLAGFNMNGAVTLYYDNSPKIATTSSGVDVTGTVTADGLTVDGDVTLNDGSPNLRLQDTDTSRYIDMAYGTRAASFTNTMASGEDIDTVEPWINFRFKDDSETRTAMTIDHDGNVSIGTSTIPTADSVLTVRKDGAANEFNILSGTSHASVINMGDADDYNIQRIKADNSSNSLQFQTNNAERMRINEYGNLLIGRTNTNSNTGGHFITSDYAFFEDNGASLFLNRFSSDGSIAIFRRQDSNVGDISVTSSGTSYNTSSDYRLKENVTYDWDATTRLKQLKPARFNFIVDADTIVDGFLAHEAQAVVPEAVTGTKDEVDDDGNPVMQGIDQSKIVPLLVKTIQELEARITALEAE